MISPYQLVSRHVEAAVAEAAAASISSDVVASNLLAEAVRLLRETRSVQDVRSALAFAMDNVEEQEFNFMRP